MSDTVNTARAQSSGPGRKLLGYAALIAFMALIIGARDAGSIEVYSVSVPVWLFGLAMYLIGVLAMWSFQKR
jgi:hypothetical protein